MQPEQIKVREILDTYMNGNKNRAVELFLEYDLDLNDFCISEYSNKHDINFKIRDFAALIICELQKTMEININKEDLSSLIENNFLHIKDPGASKNKAVIFVEDKFQYFNMVFNGAIKVYYNILNLEENPTSSSMEEIENKTGEIIEKEITKGNTSGKFSVSIFNIYSQSVPADKDGYTLVEIYWEL